MVLNKLLFIELKDYFRSPVTAFWAFAYPFFILGFLILVFGSATIQATETEQMSYGAFLLCGMLTINILSTSLFGFTVPIVENRSRGALKMYQIFPIWKNSYILAFVLSRIFILVIFNTIFIQVSSYVCNVELGLDFMGWVNLVIMLALSSTTFISVGFLLASLCSKTSTVTTVANICFFPLIFLSNAFFPAKALPSSLQWVSEYSPLQVTVRSFRGIILNNESLAQQSDTLMVLLVISIVCFLGSVKLFRWH